jgi:hypothetical protein
MVKQEYLTPMVICYECLHAITANGIDISDIPG